MYYCYHLLAYEKEVHYSMYRQRYAQYERDLVGVKNLLKKWDRVKGEVHTVNAVLESEPEASPSLVKVTNKERKV